MGDYRTIWHCLYSESDPDLKMNKGELYDKLKHYHYDEMLKKFNKTDKDVICSIGYFLRRLWERYEDKLKVFDTKVNGSTHEQDMKKKYKEIRNGSRFKNDGIYTDLLYDTYQKDWTKAYQNTFHEFFHAIDWLAYSDPAKCFSSVYKNMFFRFVNPNMTTMCGFANDKESLFGEIIIKDVENLKNYDQLNEVHLLPMHDKAPLYDAIGGVLYKEKYPDKILDGFLFTKKGDEKHYEQYGHFYSSWLKDNPRDETRRFYISKEKAMEYFEKFEPVAEEYDGMDFAKNKDCVREYFPDGKDVNLNLSEEEKKALNEFTIVAALAGKVGYGTNAEITEIIKKIYNGFPIRLAMEVFANMAATAIVNPNAHEAMRKYLPNSHKMFIEILENIVLRI